MATSTLSTIQSSLNRKRLRLPPPPPPPPPPPISISFQFHKIVKTSAVTVPLKSDWKARADVIKLLKRLEKKLTILVVSHDLKELATIVDHPWRMEMGGFLMEELLSV
uniref:ABC transporter domain-containing protein n=1 Tax=Populus trichocarpa TaxID=3694 RepID=B9GF46_POPTR